LQALRPIIAKHFLAGRAKTSTRNCKKNLGFWKDLVFFLMQNKKWWLVPVVLVILVVRALIIIGSAICLHAFLKLGARLQDC